MAPRKQTATTEDVPDTETLGIWNALRTPDPAFTKTFSKGGFKGTAISPMYSAMRMTQQFGPIGEGWGYEVEKILLLPENDEPTVVHVLVKVWYRPEGRGESDTPRVVYGWGGEMLHKYRKNNAGDTVPTTYDDEALKKATTDAVFKACSYLGLAADIHLGLFDDNKYVSEARDDFDRTRVSKRDMEPAPPPATEGDSTRAREEANLREWSRDLIARIREIDEKDERAFEKLRSFRQEFDGKVALFSKDHPAIEAVAAERDKKREAIMKHMEA